MLWDWSDATLAPGWPGASFTSDPPLSYSKTSRCRTRRLTQHPRMGLSFFLRSIAMNTIIYIVGLIVVVGLVLSFFGLR